MVGEIKPANEYNHTSYDGGKGSVDNYGQSQYIAGPGYMNNPNYNPNPVPQINPVSYASNNYTYGQGPFSVGVSLLVLLAEMIVAYIYAKQGLMIDDQLVCVLVTIPLVFGVIGTGLGVLEAKYGRRNPSFLETVGAFFCLTVFGSCCGILVLIVVWLNLL